jgi:topoisomerase-4 subunit A
MRKKMGKTLEPKGIFEQLELFSAFTAFEERRGAPAAEHEARIPAPCETGTQRAAPEQGEALAEVQKSRESTESPEEPPKCDEPEPAKKIDRPALPTDDDSIRLGLYAERSYLEYAVSVVKGRALPDVRDGQKPVQRRILYSMHEMGLAPSSKPVKSARVVGDVIGKFHPHGDQAAYDAMVRLAQDFTLRYPLVDGHGNFGSRDGDGAAAMRYTEARLTPISSLLLLEIDRGTVDFIPNYDGAFREPEVLPARLPLVLLNGATGIAVGLATEIPPHNLREVAEAAVALIENPDLTVADLLTLIKGPDYPGGGQIISSQSDILQAYETGRGSLKVRARWKVEDLARGQWQVAVHELPPGTSAQRVLEEIEDLTNPKVRTGKKSLTQDQTQTKALILSVLEAARDESDRDHPVRLIFVPRSSRIDRSEFMKTLLAHTSMESSAPVNLVMIGSDGNPRQKSLRECLAEWNAFRFETVRRRTRHRLDQVTDRIHILEGRLKVLLNIDEVIRVIREADDPKRDLMDRFALTQRQADDILEIRLRQLAKLEGIRIEQELSNLRKEREQLEGLLRSDRLMRRAIIREIESDAKTFGDGRRTLIEETERTVMTVNVVDEPLTIIMSEKGWVRSRNGHGLDLSSLSFKEGDRLAAIGECRSVDPVIFFGSDGRVFSVPASQFPGGRGDGVPVTTLVELQPGERILHMAVGGPDQKILAANSGGYGFLCKLGDLVGRQRAGKQFVTLEKGETLLKPVLYPPRPPVDPLMAPPPRPDLLVAALSGNGRIHLFPLKEMRTLSGGGRGVIIMGLDDKEEMLSVAVVSSEVLVRGTGRKGAEIEWRSSGPELDELLGRRARKGRKVPGRMKPADLEGR